MKIPLCILALVLCGCNDHGSSRNSFDAPNVKLECKREDSANSSLKFCKYTNPKGVSTCAGFYNAGSGTGMGFAASCEFYEGL